MYNVDTKQTNKSKSLQTNQNTLSHICDECVFSSRLGQALANKRQTQTLQGQDGNIKRAVAAENFCVASEQTAKTNIRKINIKTHCVISDGAI